MGEYCLEFGEFIYCETLNVRLPCISPFLRGEKKREMKGREYGETYCSLFDISIENGSCLLS